MKRLSTLGTAEGWDDGYELLPPSEIRYSDRLKVLQRFLVIACQFDPLDMSLQDINDTYSDIAAELYNE